MKGFSRQVIKYLVRCINVWYIICECLYVIGAETWEELLLLLLLLLAAVTYNQVQPLRINYLAS